MTKARLARYLLLFSIAAWPVIDHGRLAAAEGSDSDGRSRTQKPTIAPSQVRDAAQVKLEEAVVEPDSLREGPVPSWIWGANNDQQYVLRQEFSAGEMQAAWLKASCDNGMRIFLNGKPVVESDNWKRPVVVNIQKHLKPGRNELLAEVENQGGAAGFILKMALTTSEGETRYIVSDETWQAAQDKQAAEWVAARTVGKLGVGPWNNVFSEDAAPLPQIPRNVFNVLPGFQVELLYTIPKEEQGSWVALTFDKKGRLIASDQGDKGLYRITPPGIGSEEPTRVEKLNVDITSAQGLLFAFDSLYLSVNGGPGSGLYRAKDTDGDDQFDKVKKLKALRGGGEHGPHALRLSPDGKSIYIVAGNHTDPLEDLAASRIPSNWGEDLLLPRQWDANGHARGRMAPGGWIAKTDPDGQTWEMFSVGYRNSYDIAFNADGELFAYDSDMEWDLGSPWYRPTRVVHAPSGSEFGWRSGTGKWPTYYPDSLPPLVNIGPGSPVGVTFGYGTDFPAKYQKALFILDWTFGTIYAIHIEPDGASYKATHEEFVSRTPLPLTDVAVGPDGALYFAVGGRGTQSELFRVTYVGEESTHPVDAHDSRFAKLRALRRKLEDYHRPAVDSSQAIEFIWPNLGHKDRHIRYAARVALEHQDVKLWQQRVLNATEANTLISGAIALARQGQASLQPQLLKALQRLDFGKLSEEQQLALLRAYSLVFIRMGEPSEETAAQIAEAFDPYYPAESDFLNRELSRLLVYLKSPTVIAKTVELLQRKSEPSSAEVAELLARNPGYGGTIARMLANQPDRQKIHYALVLRNLSKGWTLEQRKVYFQFLEAARQKDGGASYRKFIQNIDREAFENASEQERLAIEAFGIRQPFQVKELPKPEGPGRDWTVDEVLALAEDKLKGRNFENGKKMFAATRCVICHRFAGDGGATGPDLTNAAGRFSVKDLSEALIEPNKVISDQYRASVVATSSGQVHTGRIVSENAEMLVILTDPEDPTKIVEIPKTEVEVKNESPVSLMPKDLIDSLNEDEVLDLLAYLLSRGNPRDALFRK